MRTFHEFCEIKKNVLNESDLDHYAQISDEALDNAYGYGRSSPGNTFGWQANLKSAAYAKHMIDKGITDIDEISDAIHKGWNVTAKAFVQNPERFDDTEKLKAAGKLEAKLQQRAKLMNIDYSQLPDDEQEKDRVVARALLQALKGKQGVAEVSNNALKSYQQKVSSDSMKHKADPTKRSPEKANRSVAGFAKAQNRSEQGMTEGNGRGLLWIHDKHGNEIRKGTVLKNTRTGKTGPATGMSSQAGKTHLTIKAHDDSYWDTHDNYEVVKKKQGVAKGLKEMDNRTPSGDRREKRNNSPEEKAKQDKEQQKRLTATSPEMRKKLRLPEPKQGVAENKLPKPYKKWAS
jgi:hypothetical protein